jgi:hypothetical protein
MGAITWFEWKPADAGADAGLMLEKTLLDWICEQGEWFSRCVSRFPVAMEQPV